MQSRTIFTSVLVGAAALLVAAVMIVRVIQSEAEKTRESVSSAAGSVVSDGVEQAIEAAGKSGKDVANELGETAQTIFGEIRKILDNTPGVSVPESSYPTNPTNDEAAKPTATESKSSSMPIDPAALVGEVFKTGREVTRSLDRVLQASIQLDASDERELGRQLHEMLMNRLPMIHNPKLESQLAKLAEPFLRQRNRKDIDYSFSVIDDSQVNAFAHAGGYIYVNRGLLDFVANEDELRFVLGHEIAHVDLRHCVEQVTFAARASELAGGLGASLVQIGYQAIALGYAEDREFEADARSYSLMGKGKPVAIAFLTKLAKLEPPRSDEVSNELIDVTLREIDGHFATHPSTQARITALQKLK